MDAERIVGSLEEDTDATVELTVWFTPDGSVELSALVDLILANLNATPIRGVKDGFRHPFAKVYPR